MSKFEDLISAERFLEAYLESNSKSELFRILEIPEGNSSRRFYNLMIKKMNLKPKSNWNGNFNCKNSDDEFSIAVINNLSIRSCLLELGLKPSGANYKNFYKRVKDLKLDTSHFIGRGYMKGKKNNYSPIRYQLEEILIANSPYRGGTHSLKMRLLREGVLGVYMCSICTINDWQGIPLSLHLDHINGKSNDNRIENLRLLCPNCHSQTKTYAGKNKGKN